MDVPSLMSSDEEKVRISIEKCWNKNIVLKAQACSPLFLSSTCISNTIDVNVIT